MKIAEDVMTVLSALLVDERRVVIEQQLDRPMYDKVNKVLVALGGTWSRKEKAHVFGEPAQPRIDAAIIRGEVTTAGDLGFFQTPELAARDLVKWAGVKRGERVLEPSAGEGAIVRALQDVGAIAICVEYAEARGDHLFRHVIKAPGEVTVADFMTVPRPKKAEQFDHVVMNPPFLKVGLGDHLDHVTHAYAFLKPGGTLVSILPGGVTFRMDKRHRNFRSWVADCDGTIEPMPARTFAKSGTDVATVRVKVTR